MGDCSHGECFYRLIYCWFNQKKKKNKKKKKTTKQPAEPTFILCLLVLSFPTIREDNTPLSISDTCNKLKSLAAHFPLVLETSGKRSSCYTEFKLHPFLTVVLPLPFFSLQKL